MTTYLKKPHIKPPSSSFSFMSTSALYFLLMASFLSLSILSLLFLSLSSASRHHSHSPQRTSKTTALASKIRQACKATRFPDQCADSLSQSNRLLPPNPTSLQIIQSAISLSSNNLKTAQSMVKSILDSSAGNVNRSTASKNCLDVLHNSEYRIGLAGDALPSGKIKDARAWMSAALLFQYDCWNALKYANDTRKVGETMSFLDLLHHLTSNALSMMFSYDNFGEEMDSWKPPVTERDGFWEASGGGAGSGIGLKWEFPSQMEADVTVCKDGSNGCYKTVQEAVNAAPDNGDGRKFVIHIKEGVYEEIVRVPLEKNNVVFLGDGMGKTVITGSSHVGLPGFSTYNTATVGVSGDGFMANNITFQNTAGPVTHQAVAFRSDSDLTFVENCEFIGNQDTLYAHSLRQFYKSCRIQGNVDFIFGNSATIFQDCQILIRPRRVKPEKGENNAVTAHGRTDPAQSTGFIFHNCLVNGTDDYMKLYHSKPKVHKNFLGRPWKEYSRTVFIHSFLEALITPQGWMPWTGDQGLKTLYYGEFENSGPGSDLTNRVTWSSQVPAEHVSTYSVQNFIQGNEWIPSSQ